MASNQSGSQRERVGPAPAGVKVGTGPGEHDPNAPSVADGRRRKSIHQDAVHEMEGGEPHVLSHEQAVAILDSLGIDAKTLHDGVEGEEERGTLVGHEHQAKGGTVGKLVRHYMKWARNPGDVTTIPLNDKDLKFLKDHQPKGKRLQPYQPPEE